jgi:hypothetical protein
VLHDRASLWDEFEPITMMDEKGKNTPASDQPLMEVHDQAYW